MILIILVVLAWVSVAALIVCVGWWLIWMGNVYEQRPLAIPLWFGLLFLILIPIFFITAFSGYDEVSNGTRTGTIVQFSEKGIPWKAYSGEIVLGGVGSTQSGMIANVWHFSIDNWTLRGEDKAALVEAFQYVVEHEKRVKVYYTQEIAVAFWRGRNNYLVQTVEILEGEGNEQLR